MATRQNSNPFVLPGLGQSADLGQNPLMASMEMMRQAWQGLAGTGALGQSALAASMNPEDLDRRIAELQVVENWLKMNLSMLSSTIQGLEVQRATIATVKAFMGGGAPAAGMGAAGMGTASRGGAGTSSAGVAGTGSSGADSAAQAGSHAAGAFGAAAQASAKPADSGAGSAAGSADGASTQGGGAAPGAGATPDAMDLSAVQAATQGWWEMLQKQFDTLAAATAATMRPTEAKEQPAAGAASQAKPAGKRPAAKSAPRKRAGGAGKPGKTGSAA
ncbi:PhaM family polyhydroxyalkanoate granule multifunctional regulatory protein [Candidimonas nitroreducens]|uniref:Transcriptional regulator n=1 Tax=Candidimonas nitroreducens TaxID=683354 RepID=A0A225MRP7_9BURK|nr:PhaM family polyhydroxyalkanoate granule multifunctional regulatory protein [Candidimonas nitroreducens]OWT63888.1 transcriptional regulator [Candidimonas nitroreducens]